MMRARPAVAVRARQVVCKAEIEHEQIASATEIGALNRVEKTPVFRIASG
jgi:hypothetical protein